MAARLIKEKFAKSTGAENLWIISGFVFLAVDLALFAIHAFRGETLGMLVSLSLGAMVFASMLKWLTEESSRLIKKKNVIVVAMSVEKYKELEAALLRDDNLVNDPKDLTRGAAKQ